MSLPTTEAELRALYEELRDQLIDIDAQLASRAVRPDGTRNNSQHYREWRNQAINAKQSRTRRLVRIKQKLAAFNEPKADSTRFWREQCLGLAEAIEEGPRRALEALNQYQQALSLRKEERVDRGNG